MKRYLMFSVLCLVACGAGASGGGDSDDSSLSSPLSDGDDDAPDPNVALASTGDDDATSDDPWQGADERDDGASADEADDVPEDIPPLPSPGGPVVVVGAGGGEWTSPANGTVVWCHASVPVGCGASAPAPGAGRLVVVRGRPSGGEPVQVDAGAEAAADAPSADASGSGVTVVSGTVDIFETEAAPGQAPVAIPVTAGGSVPPLPGTCVVITFQNLGSGPGAAEGDQAPLPPLPALPPPGGCLDVMLEPGSVSALAGGGVTAPAPGDEPPLPTTPPGGAAPVPGAPPVVVPLPPPPVGGQSGACFSVAFAGEASAVPSAGEGAGEGTAVPVPTPPLPAPPVICAAPAQPGTRSAEPRPAERRPTEPR